MNSPYCIAYKILVDRLVISYGLVLLSLWKEVTTW